MKSFLLKSAVSAMMIASLGAQAGVHWGYKGEVDPDKWADLSPEYQMCRLGQNQSPVDINSATAIRAQNPASIELNYNVAPKDIVNNGHTLQVSTGNNADYIVLDGQKFFLKQFHFHTPSENKINGKSYP